MCKACTLGKAKMVRASKLAVVHSKIEGELLFFILVSHLQKIFDGKKHWLLVIEGCHDGITQEPTSYTWYHQGYLLSQCRREQGIWKPLQTGRDGNQLRVQWIIILQQNRHAQQCCSTAHMLCFMAESFLVSLEIYFGPRQLILAHNYNREWSPFEHFLVRGRQSYFLYYKKVMKCVSWPALNHICKFHFYKIKWAWLWDTGSISLSATVFNWKTKCS